MGIFGALTTAVTGMRAQAYALENISGNIANSQTLAFKRIDTSFLDLIPDNSAAKQLAGSVVANSRSTNVVQGDIQNASIGTFMAINGEGFFVVQKPSTFSDNRPIFDGVDLYTRRGDFQTDRDGYLVNGAGYYLMGIPVDPTTGNLVGSVPQLLRFEGGFLPAQATSRIEYRANLANLPRTANYDANVPGSELLNPSFFAANPLAGPPQPARILGTGAAVLPDAAAINTGTLDLSGLSAPAGNIVVNGTTIAIATGDDAATVRDKINAEAATTGVAASLNAGGRLVLTSADSDTHIAIGGASSLPLLGAVGLAVGTTHATNLLTQSIVSPGQTLSFTVGANPPLTITFGTGPGEISTLTELSTALASLTGGIGSVDTSSGNITITAGNMTEHISVGGTAAASNFGIRTLSALPANGTVVASDLDNFVKSSISGGAITAYDVTGSPVNIQLRWAKTDSQAAGGVDTWNLFYQVNSNASGTDVAWRNAGIDYTFGPNGQLNPVVGAAALNNVVVDGVTLGNVELFHGGGGITQFADANGNVQVNFLQQNGFAAGELQQVYVNDKGRVVGVYSNGRTIDLAEVTLANFNGANSLRRIDGGAFAATDASGPPAYNAPGKIVGSSLEGSNTDIADEFTKLIVTQQAYSANTRVISTSNQMVQDLLNMLR